MLLLTASPGTGYGFMLAPHSLAAAELTQGVAGCDWSLRFGASERRRLEDNDGV
jgi:hypothetical protein